MKSQNNLLFIKSIFIYLIFQKLYYSLCSINNIILIKFNPDGKLYFLGFIFSGIVTLLVICFLYKKLIENVEATRFNLIKSMFLFFIILSLYFLLNKLTGNLYENLNNQEVFKKHIEYVGYTEIVYFFTALIGLIGYWVLFLKKKGNSPN